MKQFKIVGMLISASDRFVISASQMLISASFNHLSSEEIRRQLDSLQMKVKVF